MENFSANEVLLFMAKLLSGYLEELREVKDCRSQQFAYGEKTAYTECLELIQLWEDAGKNGLDYDIEKQYPL